MAEPKISGVTLRQLEIFAAVVSAGSVSGATRRTGLSQPTISHHIGKLEESLGASLLARGRGSEVALTPAGEYWFRCAGELLGDFNRMCARHIDQYAQNRLVLRFGTTPSLRGRFLGAAARIALKEPEIARFEFVWGMTSADVVEQIRLHQLNIGVVNEASIKADQGALSVSPLFTDRIVWAAPRSIPDRVIQRTLLTRAPPDEPYYSALTRYVDVGNAISWAGESEDWYRTNLPFAMPYFSCPTHQAATDLVADGVATCHFPLALLPNLSASTIERISLFELDNFSRNIVLVMPKHLLNVAAFANFRAALIDFAKDQYAKEMEPVRVVEMPKK